MLYGGVWRCMVYVVCEYEWDVYECNVRAQNQPFNPIRNVFKRIHSNLEYLFGSFFGCFRFVLSILYICAMHTTIQCVLQCISRRRKNGF